MINMIRILFIGFVKYLFRDLEWSKFKVSLSVLKLLMLEK